MGRHFVENQTLVTEDCCSCGITFAMPEDFQRRCRDDSAKWFFCPNGHRQHYTGQATETQRLRREVERANAEAERARDAAQKERDRAARISRSYSRVRQRIRNGVCPCCNRTFDNLARHMATKHPDYGSNKQLRALRLAYGLTQEQLAKEAGVPTPYVSLYERGMELPKSGRQAIESWLNQQTDAA